MSKQTIEVLLVIFVLAYILRAMFLPHLALTFGYDQARDAIISQQILNGDLKILGPPASTPGLYHGVFYYYVLAVGYILGQGSPIVATYWIAFLNSLTIFIVFALGYLLTRRWYAAVLASLFFAVSFEATQYATWLSNPTIGIWTVSLLYLGLWVWVHEKRWWGPLVCGLGLGLSVQAEVFLLYHVVPILVWLWVSRKSITRHQLASFLLAFLAAISTMIIAEIKFGFRSIGGVAQLLLAQDPIVLSRGLGDFLLLYLNQLGKVFAYGAYPGNLGYGGVFVLFILILALFKWKKGKISWEPFLATWLLSHLTVVSVGGTSTPFLLVGIGPAVSLLLGIFLERLWSRGNRVTCALLIAVILVGNLSMIIKENKKGQTIFAIQKDMVLSKELPAIDYTYEKAGGEPFSINSLTSPLWINIVWTYLYQWYGEPRYGYIPEWHGRDQVGQLASLPPTTPSAKKYFLILEPMAGIPTHFLPDTIAEEDGVSTLISEKSFGELIVQERERKATSIK